jgi:ribonucleoside-diphosphate reductase alpha chain
MARTTGYEAAQHQPGRPRPRQLPGQDPGRPRKKAWDRALELGEKHGFRNAQSTVIAPTGTIGLVMDCDTTGIEPDFALVKFKKLAGGGYFKIINRAVPEALRGLGYEAEIAEIEAYAVGHGSIDQAPGINPTTLKAKGFSDESLAKIKASLGSAFDIKFVFNRWTVGDEQMAGLMVPEEKLTIRPSTS